MKHNLGLKILALAVAIIIWVQIILMDEHQSKVNLELRLVQSTTADTLRPQPKKILCQVQGKGLDILKLYFSRAYVEMSASDYWAGNDKNFRIVNMPENIKVNFINVIPPPPYENLKAEDLAKISNKESETTIISDQEKTEELSPPKETTIIDSQDPIVTRILYELPISTPWNLKIFPPKATLKVQGKASLLARLPQGISITISPTPDNEGYYTVYASVPENVTILDITPQKVRVIK